MKDRKKDTSALNEIALRRCKHELCKKLHITEVLTILESCDVLNNERVLHIKAESVEYQRNEMMIDMLQNKCGPEAFDIFIFALTESNQKYLAEMLTNKVAELKSSSEFEEEEDNLDNNPLIAGSSRISSRPNRAASAAEVKTEELRFHSAMEYLDLEYGASTSASQNESDPRETDCLAQGSTHNKQRRKSSMNVTLGDRRTSQVSVRRPSSNKIEKFTIVDDTERSPFVTRYRKAFSINFLMGFAFFLLICLLFHLYSLFKLLTQQQLDSSYGNLQDENFATKLQNFSIPSNAAHKNDTRITWFALLAFLHVAIIISCSIAWIIWKFRSAKRLRWALASFILFCGEIALLIPTFVLLFSIDALGESIISEFTNGVNDIPAEVVVLVFKCCPKTEKDGYYDYQRMINTCSSKYHMLTKCDALIKERVFSKSDFIFGINLQGVIGLFVLAIIIGVLICGYKWWKAAKIIGTSSTNGNAVNV